MRKPTQTKQARASLQSGGTLCFELSTEIRRARSLAGWRISINRPLAGRGDTKHSWLSVFRFLGREHMSDSSFLSSLTITLAAALGRSEGTNT
mmetsp:Transcript_72791/g.109806  ORF Transcript_72791/g.109806 Transcript_72791/m.109806 type:complete len:93 (-) Transcript_72791:162-440(-)